MIVAPERLGFILQDVDTGEIPPVSELSLTSLVIAYDTIKQELIKRDFLPRGEE